MSNDLFTQLPKITPTIYAYELVDISSHIGLLIELSMYSDGSRQGGTI